MATQHNFRIKNGLEIAGVQRISSAGVITGTLDSNTTATTQSALNNSTKIATTAYTDAAITAVIGGAPGTLDTLNELAAAINDDASYASTLTTALAGKLPLAGGTLTGNLKVDASFTVNGNVDTSASLGEVLQLSQTDSVGGFLWSVNRADGAYKTMSYHASNHKFYRDQTNLTLTLDSSSNATFAGTINSGAITTSGNVSVGGSAYTTSADLNLLGDGLAIKNDKNGSNNNWSLIQNTGTSGAANLAFTTGLGSALTLNHDRSATFDGTISSGAITSSGPITVNNVNDTYNFKAIAGDTDSWFGVYDDGNNSANVIVTRSDGATSFLHLGHTGATTINGTLSCGAITSAGITAVGSGNYSTGTVGLISKSVSNRGTVRIRSDADNAAELFFDVNGAIRWDLSARQSSSNYDLLFYPQHGTPALNAVAGHVLRITQTGHLGIGTNTSARSGLDVDGAVTSSNSDNDLGTHSYSSYASRVNSGRIDVTSGYSGTFPATRKFVFKYDASSWKAFHGRITVSGTGGFSSYEFGGYWNNSGSCSIEEIQNTLQSTLAFTTSGQAIALTLTIGQTVVHPCFSVEYNQSGGDGPPRMDRAEFLLQ